MVAKMVGGGGAKKPQGFIYARPNPILGIKGKNQF
jgi:hypothetical protein